MRLARKKPTAVILDELAPAPAPKPVTPPKPEVPKPATIYLHEVHPQAQLLVMVHIQKAEAGFMSGESLRQNWESREIHRMSPWSMMPTPPGWHRVKCPDGADAVVKFLSVEFQLLDEQAQPHSADEAQTTQPDKKPNKPMATKPTPPPKKTPAKAPVKPVAAAKSAVAKTPKAPKSAKPAGEAGDYKWLLQRLKAQALNAVSTTENRATIRDGLKACESFSAVREFLERAGASANFGAFLDEFFSATIKR